MSAGELIVSIIGDMSKLSGVFQQVQSDIGNFGSKLTSIGSSLSSVGTGMTAGITAPILAASAGIGIVTNEAVGFEKGMAQVFTLLPNISEKGMGSMTQDVLDFSDKMKITTDTVVPALYDAIGSGVPKENVFSFLEVAQKSAVAANTDLGTSVNGLTSILNAYGTENINVAQASDILFTGINVGKMTFEELSKSLYDVVPTAASLKVPFSDITAALAAMTAQGTPTTVATTQLRQLLVELSKDGSKTAETFEALAGKSFAQFIKEGGNLNGAIQILNDGMGKTVPGSKDLQKAMMELADPTSNLAQEFEALTGKSFKDFQKEGGTAEQAIDKLGLKFGDTKERVSDYFGSVEAGNAILSLTGQGAGIFNNALGEMDKSAGATEKAYQRMSETSSKSMDEIKASFQLMAVELGSKVLPVLNDTLVPLFQDTIIPAMEKAIPVIGKILEAFNGLPQPVKIVALAFVAFMAALGPILIIAGSVASAIGSIAALFGTGGALATAMTFISGTVIPALGTALGVLLSPIGLIAIAVAALALAWKYNWFDIQGKTREAVDFIKEKWNQFTSELGRLPGVASSAFGTLSSIFSNSWNSIRTYLSTAITGILTDLQNWVTRQTEKLNSGITYLSNFKTQALVKWAEIKTGILAKLNELVNDAQFWVTRQSEKFNQAITSITNLKTQALARWTEIKTSIKTKLTELINDIQTWIANQTAKFNDAIAKLGTFKTQALAKWTEIKTAIKAKFNELIADIQAWITSNVAKLNDMVAKYNTFKTQVISKWTEIKTAIKSKLDEIVTEIKNKATSVETAVNSIVTKIQNKVSDFKNAGKAIIQALKDGVEEKIQSVKDSINGLLSWIDKHMPHSPAEEGPLSRLPNFSEYISSPLVSAVSSAKNTAKNAGSSIISSISNGIKSAASSVYNAASSALKKVSSLLPHSPAKEGPFSTLPDWDSVFYTPMMKSIKNVSGLAAPLSNALSNVKSPISGSIGAGLQSVSNVSNSSTVVEGSRYSIGPNYVRNDSDLEAIIAAVKSSIANDRRRAGIF